MPQFKAESIDKNKELLEMFSRLAKEKHVTPAQISIVWMMRKGIVPIPGTRKLSWLEENAGAADITLTAQEVSDIDSALSSMEMSEFFGGHKVS